MAHRSIIMVKRTYLHLAIITVVTAILWLALSIYQSLTTPTDITIDPAIKAPFNATLDQEVLNMILSREDLSQLSFEPPTASRSAVTINEVVPASTESANTTINPSTTPE